MEIKGLQRRFTGSPLCAVGLEPRQQLIAGNVRGAGAGSKITGYAAVFYDGKPGTQYQLYDDMVERIIPGAFDRAVKEDDVRALFNHDADHILGRTVPGTLRLSVDKKGLRYIIDPPETNLGRDLVTSIRRGDITGSSFAFIATDVTWRQEDGVSVREIRGVQLFDVGPVTYPAYVASTSGVSDGGGANSARGIPQHVLPNVAASLAAYRLRAAQVTEEVAKAALRN